jgi:hypothetical protein
MRHPVLTGGSLEPNPTPDVTILERASEEQSMSLEPETDHRQNNPLEDGPDATEETIRVRQGVTGHNVRYVLGISMAAVIIVLIIAGIYVGQ